MAPQDDTTNSLRPEVAARGPGEVIDDFDVAADGRRIVFDRSHEASDIALIELTD